MKYLQLERKTVTVGEAIAAARKAGLLDELTSAAIAARFDDECIAGIAAASAKEARRPKRHAKAGG